VAVGRRYLGPTARGAFNLGYAPTVVASATATRALPAPSGVVSSAALQVRQPRRHRRPLRDRRPRRRRHPRLSLPSGRCAPRSDALCRYDAIRHSAARRRARWQLARTNASYARIRALGPRPGPLISRDDPGGTRQIQFAQRQLVSHRRLTRLAAPNSERARARSAPPAAQLAQPDSQLEHRRVRHRLKSFRGRWPRPGLAIGSRGRPSLTLPRLDARRSLWRRWDHADLTDASAAAQRWAARRFRGVVERAAWS
jgi:hypothetical protein